MKEAFDINRTLRRFLPDPIEFRCLQARTGTLVSGSVALQFFDRTYYPSSDLDLYVYMSCRREVGIWLLSQGFTFTPSQRQLPVFQEAVLDLRRTNFLTYAMPGVSAIYTFHREVPPTRVKVQVIVACRAPMEIILGFHSSEFFTGLGYTFELTTMVYMWDSLRYERDIV